MVLFQLNIYKHKQPAGNGSFSLCLKDLKVMRNVTLPLLELFSRVNVTQVQALEFHAELKGTWDNCQHWWCQTSLHFKLKASSAKRFFRSCGRVMQNHHWAVIFDNLIVDDSNLFCVVESSTTETFCVYKGQTTPCSSVFKSRWHLWKPWEGHNSLGINWSVAFGKNYLIEQESVCIAMVMLPSMTLCRELLIRTKGECTWCVLCQQSQGYQSPSSRRHRPSYNFHRQKSMCETKWEEKLMTFALCLKTNQESIVTDRAFGFICCKKPAS